MSGACVVLADVTAETVRAICALETSEGQRRFVAPNAVSIAQAYFHPEAQFKAICRDDVPVGFIMWRPGETFESCVLWRFMIDRRHQGQGHGRAALTLWMAAMSRLGVKRIETSFVAGDAGPRDFYRALGFVESGGQKPNGEWPMTIGLQPELSPLVQA